MILNGSAALPALHPRWIYRRTRVASAEEEPFRQRVFRIDAERVNAGDVRRALDLGRVIGFVRTGRRLLDGSSHEAHSDDALDGVCLARRISLLA